MNTGYDASKLSRERYGEYFANHYDLHVAGLRFFSVYRGYGGAEAHQGEYANVIAQFADDIANGRSPTRYGDVPVNGVNGSQRVAACERSEPDRLARAPRRATSPTSTTSTAASSWSPTTSSATSTTPTPVRITASTSSICSTEN